MAKKEIFSNRLGKKISLSVYSYENNKGEKTEGINASSLRELFSNDDALQHIVPVPSILFCNDKFVIAKVDIRESNASMGLTPLACGTGSARIIDGKDNAPEFAIAKAMSAAMVAYLQLPKDMYTDIQYSGNNASEKASTNKPASTKSEKSTPVEKPSNAASEEILENFNDEGVDEELVNDSEDTSESNSGSGIITEAEVGNIGDFDYTDNGGGTITDASLIPDEVTEKVPQIQAFKGKTIGTLIKHYNVGKATAPQLAFLNAIKKEVSNVESPFNTNPTEVFRTYRYLAQKAS